MTPHQQQLLTAALHLADQGGPTPAWRNVAACRNEPDTTYWPGNGHTDRAQRICAACPAQLACLADGITTERAGIPAGIRAGIPRPTIRAAAQPAPRRRGPAIPTHNAHQRAHDLTRAGHTAATIAALLGVSERTIQRWRTHDTRAADHTRKAA